MVGQKQKQNIVLGISGFYHDSAAALVIDGEVVSAAHEERFTRIKHDERFPKHAILYCLDEAKISLDQVDAVVFYDKPFLKLERLLETYLAFAPRGVKSFISAAIVWIKEKFFLRSLLEKELKSLLESDTVLPPLLFTEHHLSHAASAFYPSPFTEAAIVTIDGVGEWATTSISVGEKDKIKTIKEIHFPHSIGLLYSAFTYFLGFKVNSGEYKLMGLAPYGRRGSKTVADYKALIYKHLLVVHPDGSFSMDQQYFDYATGDKMIREGKWESVFQMKTKSPDSDFNQAHCDLALAIQEVTEELVLKLLKHAKEVTGKKMVCMAGGVALNCVANAKIQKAKIFDDIWIQPAAGDAGGALGAAFAAAYMYFNVQRKIHKTDAMQGSYLGPSYSECQIETKLDEFRASYTKIEDNDTLYKQVADLIAAGNVVGWFQGRMEWGPRALGNRSILADPRNPEMQKKLNLKIKYREGFRPFAPSVLAEHSHEVFETTEASPYMLFVSDVLSKHRKQLPEDFDKWDLMKKLYVVRSHIPAITHLDYSARLQTVHKETNERYWRLINAFYQITGVPLVVNTSFNVRGEPIVCTPENALQCFMQTEMDYLCLGNYLLKKEDQVHTIVKKQTFAAD